MRILIQTLGSSGDLLPFLVLAQALGQRGHEVRLWANEVFQEQVEQAGVTWRSAGPAQAYRAAQDDPELWHPRRGLGVVLRTGVVPTLESQCRALLQEIEPGRTLLISGSLGLAARLAQEASGTPHATVHLAPAVYRSLARLPRLGATASLDWAPSLVKRWFWWLGDRQIDPHIVPELTRVRRALGLAPVRRVFDQWFHSPDLCLGLWPDWFAPPQADWPPQAQQVGFVLPGAPTHWSPPPDLTNWLAAGEAPVVVTGGSANIHAAPLCLRAAEVLQKLGRRALLVTRSPDLTPARLPTHAHHVPYAPFGWLFPRALGLISHGGIGTTAQALAAGLPHLVAAMGFDQFDNGSRLRALGVGEVVSAAHIRGRAFVRILAALLENPRPVERSQRWADEMRGDRACERAVNCLEALPASAAPRLPSARRL